MPRRIVTLALVIFALALANPAFADQVNLGTISFDNLLPPDLNGAPGTNGFNIFNLTGSFDLPPDFAAAQDVTFDQSTLALVGVANSAPFKPTIILGGLGPGPLQGPDGFPPLSLQFPDTTTFSQAEFQAKLSSLIFGLADGSVFTADSNKIDVLLLPLQGNNNLNAGDSVVISVSGTISAPVVPEPASWQLLLLAIPWTGYHAWKRQKQRQRP